MDVLYGQVEDYLVFVPRARAIELVALQAALSSSATWQDFRSHVSTQDYEQAMGYYEDALTFEDFAREEREAEPELGDAELRERYGQLRIGERPPIDQDAFSLDHIPWYGDGDYPEWPAQQMLKWVPESIRSTFGHTYDTVLNGPYLTFDPVQERDLLAAFESAGFRCVRDDALVRRASGYERS
jgi:hypothetical protein